MSFIKKLKLLAEDTLFRGAFCGLASGIFKDVIDFILYSFNNKEVVFWYFASILAYHKKPVGFLMHTTSLTLELIFSSFLGIVYLFIARNIKSRHYLILGAFYGSMVWFSVKAVIVAYKINELKPHTIMNPLITWLLSALFGVCVAILDRKLAPQTS